MAVNYVVNHDTLETNLLAWWGLNEESDGSGAVTRYDAHGSYHLTDNNTVPSATGKVGKGASFTAGNNEFFTWTSDASTTNLNTYSFAFWFKRSTTPSGVEYIMSGDRTGTNAGDMRFYVKTNGTVEFAMDNGSGTPYGASTTNICDNAWHHVAITADGTNVRIYIDGNSTPEATIADTTNWNIGDVDHHIGEAYTGGGNLTGELDEFGMWSKTLTTDEISDLYNGGEGMGYGIDVVNSAEFNPGATTSTTTTFSHTVDSSADLLVVGITVFASSDLITSVTYNGVTMTKVGHKSNAANVLYAYQYYLANPATGANDLVINTSSAENPRAVCIDCIGSDTSSPLDASAEEQDSGTTLDSNVTAGVDNVLHIGHFCTNRAWSSNGTGTSLIQEAGSAGYVTIRSSGLVDTGASNINYAPSSTDPGVGVLGATYKTAAAAAAGAANNAMFSFGGI